MYKYRLGDKVVWKGREAEVLAVDNESMDESAVTYLLRVKNYDEGHRGSVYRTETLVVVEGFTESDKNDCWWAAEESIEKLLERKLRN